MARPPLPEDERFWRHVDVRGPNECWPWTAKRQQKSGYGLFAVAKDKDRPFGLGNSTYTTAHREAYRLTFGIAIPESLKGLHSCDNPPCCNPRHIRPGTQKENLAEMYTKGREPDTNKTRHIGEQHGRAIITDAEVIEIRELYRATVYSQDRLAAIYGVGQTQISRIIRGESRRVLTPNSSPSEAELATREVEP